MVSARAVALGVGVVHMLDYAGIRVSVLLAGVPGHHAVDSRLTTDISYVQVYLCYNALMKLTKEILERAYIIKMLSVAQIAEAFNCTEGKVNYWLKKYSIQKRTISDALYKRLNPKGDPYIKKGVLTQQDAFLLGLGLGLYWGEGTKKNENTVRLGNTDPFLIKTFLLFLRDRYGIQEHRLRYGLQVFSDMDLNKEELFWQRILNAEPEQFYKTIVSVSGSVGTYRDKSPHGVLTLYFHNKRLRDLLVSEIEKLRYFDYHTLVPLNGNKKPM